RALRDRAHTLQGQIIDPTPDKTKPSAVLGPVVLPYPDEEEGCKILLKWQKDKLRALFTHLAGSKDTSWGEVSCQCPSNLTNPQKDRLRNDVHTFVEDRMKKAFAAGYRFRVVTLDEDGHVVAKDAVRPEFEEK